MTIYNHKFYFFIVLLVYATITSCENKTHHILNRDIAENEITDGNIVFVKPNLTEFSYEYVNDNYSICITHPGDTLTKIVLYSDVLKWYQRINFHKHVERFKEQYIKGCIIKKESEIIKTLHNAEIQTYKVDIVKSNTPMVGEISVIYNKKERKLCIIESICMPTDKIKNDIVKTLRYK